MKYYVIMFGAEETYGYIKYLTKEEADIFKYIIDDSDASYHAGGGYCGGCAISKGFDTLEEAIEDLRNIL